MPALSAKLKAPDFVNYNNICFCRQQGGKQGLPSFQALRTYIKSSYSVTAVCIFIPEKGQSFSCFQIYNVISPGFPAICQGFSNYSRHRQFFFPEQINHFPEKGCFPLPPGAADNEYFSLPGFFIPDL